nr:hypothetical protein [Achromobacter ruhlandii]
MPGGYMLNGGYVAAALLFIAALFGVLVVGLVAGWRAGRGSRLQLVLAWLLALALLPPWLLALAADGDIFGVVLISRYALALPALAALWWLRRSIRLFTGLRPGLERLPRTPWLLLLAAVLLYSLLGYWSGHRYDYSFDINDTITSMVFIVATGLLVAGCAWALRSSIRWLRLAGPGSVAGVARR